MSRYWYQEQLRILQTVLREKDAAQYDAEAVVRYMKETGSNCLVVNGGGVVDFFSGDIIPGDSLPADNIHGEAEMGRPCRFLNGQDILGKLVKACHASQIRVIARVDFRGVEKERYERKPHWFGQGEDGTPLMGWNDRIHRPCYTGIYGNSHAEEFVRRLMERYDLDGIWENCVTFGYGACYCPSCRESYRACSGKEIPTGQPYTSEAFREYREWKSIHAKAHMERMRQTVKSFGEEKAYVSEIFGMYHVSTSLNSGIDLYDAKDEFDFLVSPLFLDGSAEPERKYEDYSHAASGVRFLKAIAPEKQCVALSGGNGTKWRYVTAPRLENRIWLWEAVSTGGNLWNNYFNGQCPAKAVDRRAAGAEKEIYQYLKEHAEFLDGQIPDGETGVFYSRATRDVWGRDSMKEDGYGTAIRGVERVLFDCHIPYRFVTDLELSDERLKGLKVLILPNAACISEEHVEVIRRFVRNGGGLVASFRTSLYDERGNRRPDFGLKDVFGCSFTGIVRDTRQDSYQKVRLPQHPVLKGMDADRTDMIMNEEETLLCTRQNQEYHMVASFVPMIYNQPPEYAWIPEEETEYPTILAGQYGKGRVVYFANQTDKACFTNGHEDFINSFYNAVEWASGGFSFRAQVPESVHVALTCDRERPGRKVISFVNATSGPFRPVRSLLPVYGLEVRITGLSLKGARSLREESEIEVLEQQQGGEKQIVIRIPCLREFSSVFLDTEEEGK